VFLGGGAWLVFFGCGFGDLVGVCGGTFVLVF